MMRSACVLITAFSAALLAPVASSQTNWPQGLNLAAPPYAAFQRVASFPVFLNTSIEEETVAEIVAASSNGKTLIYTDSQTEKIGFVDIADPTNPLPSGALDVGGEPTSVAVAGQYALVVVNTSPDFINTSGLLHVVRISNQQIVRTISLGGQPDAIAISPNKRWAAIAIENERDEELGNGEPPQAPPGFVTIVDMNGPVNNWSTSDVSLVGIPDVFPEDPEPEYIAINAANIAAVTLQENNHIVLIHVPTGSILGDFPAGEVDLNNVDVEENGLIELNGSLSNVAREPDAIAWTSVLGLATADEGDLFGGSRGFTLFDLTGQVWHESGASVETQTVRLGHYPEDRSENKGGEPEAIAYANYFTNGFERLLFVGCERSSLVFVYRLPNVGPGTILGGTPQLMQALPTGVGPEGLCPVPQRDLLVVASEEDSRADKVRSVISIYKRTNSAPQYPTIRSANRPDGSPIPWAALSALAADPKSGDVYTLHDSYYQRSRIFRMDVDELPAVITDEIVLNDASALLATSLINLQASLPNAADFDPAELVNPDGTVNLDPEGLAVAADGGFWVASEGGGNLINGLSNPSNQPFTGPNLLLHASPTGAILHVAQLPLALINNQFRFGYEGVAVVEDDNSEFNGRVIVAFQRAWTAAGDPSNRTRIGLYDPATGQWTFAHYPLDAPTSPNGGWVGLSEITYIGNDEFVVIERDDQAGPDARIKRLYAFSIVGVQFKPNDQVANFEAVDKSLIRDILMAGDFNATGGLILEKLEGFAVLSDGNAVIVNDNDGVDGSNGETQLLNLGKFRD